MCGIIAISGKNIKNISDGVANAMLETLSRRGPDDHGFNRLGDAILGQTRLSIVDIAGGHQPMKDSEKPYTVTFNGEIYGYKEARKELEVKGHIFTTNSDTEVILKAYAEYGDKCTEHLDGMFSFALWDDIKKELFIARDRFGKKPLYYTTKDDVTYFASEIKAFFAIGIKGEVDKQTIDEYLTLMYIPPWKSIYKNIHVLPPAHAGIVKNGNINTWKYWSLPEQQINVSAKDAKREIKKLFDTAVKNRMIADVEIGSFLSGGLDSTLVTSYAQKYSKSPIKTFSVGYEGYINELPYAKQASEKIGTEHYTLEVKSNLTSELEKVIAYMDEPHADSSNFPQHLVSELASSKVKVALSGDGADELFMGYGWYWKYWNVQKLTRIKNALFSNPFKEYIRNTSVFQKNDRNELWKNFSPNTQSIQEKAMKGTRAKGIHKINLFDLTVYLPGQLLSKVDRTSMMHSLEVRCPFLDYKLAEYVYSLPESLKTDRTNGKIILKEIMEEIMPVEFVHRRKQGFGAPVKAWLATEDMKNFVKKNLGKNSFISAFFNESELERYVTSLNKNEKNPDFYKVWVLLCLELWLKSHKDNVIIS